VRSWRLHNPIGLHDLLQGKLYFLYADIRTSLETLTFAACYGESFTSYMQTIFVPHWKQTFAACYKESFISYMQMIFVPHWKHRRLRLVTGKAFLLICIRYSYLTGNMDLRGLLQGKFSFLYADDIRTSLETWTSAAC
jgi:hypothetical protein